MLNWIKTENSEQSVTTETQRNQSVHRINYIYVFDFFSSLFFFVFFLHPLLCLLLYLLLPSSFCISSLVPPSILLSSPPFPPPSSVRTNWSQRPQNSKHSTQPSSLSLSRSLSLAHTNTQEFTCLSPSLPLSLSLTLTHRNLHVSRSLSGWGVNETEFTENKTEQSSSNTIEQHRVEISRAVTAPSAMKKRVRPNFIQTTTEIPKISTCTKHVRLTSGGIQQHCV